MKNKPKTDRNPDTLAPKTKPDTSIVKAIKEQVIKKNKDKTDKMLNDLNQGKY